MLSSWWSCPTCNYFNNGTRTSCRRCTNNKSILKAVINTLSASSTTTNNCIICTENVKSIALKTCGHFLYCDECSKNASITCCPVCRVKYEQTDLLKIYDA